MKKLIFVDNDNNDIALDTIDYVKDNLEYFGGLTAEQVSTIQIVSDFHFLGKDKQGEMMFDLENIILTWSMFTASHYNSLGKLRHFLTDAGFYDIKGKTYIDTASNLKKALTQIIENSTENLAYFIRGLEANNIIGMESKTTTFHRFRFDALADGFIRIEDVNIPNLVSDTNP